MCDHETQPRTYPIQACFKYPSPSLATHCHVGGLRTLTGFPGGPGGPDGPSGPGSPWKQERPKSYSCAASPPVTSWNLGSWGDQDLTGKGWPQPLVSLKDLPQGGLSRRGFCPRPGGAPWWPEAGPGTPGETPSLQAWRQSAGGRVSRGVAGAHLGAGDSNLTRETNRSRWSLGTETSLARMPQRVSPSQGQR